MFSEKFEQKIDEIYEKRRGAFPELFEKIDKKINACESSEQRLLRYLYGNMPLSDAMNYPFETFFDYASHGVFLWENGTYRKEIEEETFCQYVVYHRINTEDISPCRSFFYEKAKHEIEGCATMTEAVLALNYWCAQEATYCASDERTASPMTVYRSAHGRCGEESTFTVSVLRSQGIPARQVYAPRWSHCDDNHAWVEVKCNHTWHFLGACEPEEILDKGWFLHASSRAMLIHSRWYGDLALAGKEVESQNLIATKGITTEINEIHTYAYTDRVTVNVLDTENKPAVGAQVRIEVLNYSEFYPIAELHTDDQGMAEIELGLGSFRAYACLGEKEATKIIDVRTENNVTLVLKAWEDSCNQDWQIFESLAPQDAVIHSGFVTEEQKRIQKEKLSNRTRIRLEKKGTGNEKEVDAFLFTETSDEEKRSYRKRMLDTLTKKDLLDLRADVLETHLQCAWKYKKQWEKDQREDQIFVKYILSPRIFYEVLTDYRSGIAAILTRENKEEFSKNPTNIWRYIKSNIREMPAEEYQELITLPVPCLTYRMGSRKSQEILFVAICRTLGIPARLNPIDGDMEYFHNKKFVKVITSDQSGCLNIQSEGKEKFVYFQNWSVTNKTCGQRKLLNLSLNPLQKETNIQLRAGRYEIITANRLPNGNVLGRTREISIHPDMNTTVTLQLEEAELSQMLECVPVPSFAVKTLEGEKLLLTDILKSHTNLVIWLMEGQEPTEHILNELCECAAEFNNENVEITFLVNNENALKQPTLHKALELLQNVKVRYDSIEERVAELGRRFYVNPESTPLILVTDGEVNCVYAASGYNVGTADMILKILHFL